MAREAKANEIQINRLYDAPVKAVWDAWTDLKQVAQWWGPRGFSITTHSKDLRPGGHWRYTMHGPDGEDYPNHTTYFEVEPLRKLVYDHGANDTQPALFRVTVLFSEVGNKKTLMEMTMTLPTPEKATEIAGFIKKAGGNATWDRLAEHLEENQRGRAVFVINRSFRAPIEKVYAMWTNPQHLTKWLPPTGFSMSFIRDDLREGGSTFFRMDGPGDISLFGRAEYQELKPPHRIAYRQQFCDAEERLSRHPLAPTWPETMLTTVEFTEEAPAQTRVTVTTECYGAVTAAELESFIKERPGMTRGWTGSLDALEDTLNE